jgi:hypothetical protein
MNTVHVAFLMEELFVVKGHHAVQSANTLSGFLWKDLKNQQYRLFYRFDW